MEAVTILGSTGSIGKSTLDVLSRHPERYRVFALTADTSVDTLHEQARQYQPEFVVLRDPAAAKLLQSKLNDTKIAVLSGVEGLEQVASHPLVNTVVSAIVGAAGLLPTFAAVKSGKKILLANKETLVMSAEVFMSAAKAHGATILPVDSEHNAILQCLPWDGSGETLPKTVKKIVLTASGGPFYATPLSDLKAVTPEDAVAHPNWDMGPKISIDSATMMNKGLEVIEARWLFNAPIEAIDVVIHPQSIIHSMVSYVDGSYLAQLGAPDMRTPIACALAWPSRIESGLPEFDITQVADLHFEQPDKAKFPALELAFEALRQGGTATTILNAANEIAVQSFMEQRIGFLEIPRLVAATLDESDIVSAATLETVLAADKEAREIARRLRQKFEAV